MTEPSRKNAPERARTSKIVLPQTSRTQSPAVESLPGKEILERIKICFSDSGSSADDESSLSAKNEKKFVPGCPFSNFSDHRIMLLGIDQERRPFVIIAKMRVAYTSNPKYDTYLKFAEEINSGPEGQDIIDLVKKSFAFEIERCGLQANELYIKTIGLQSSCYVRPGELYDPPIPSGLNINGRYVAPILGVKSFSNPPAPNTLTDRWNYFPIVTGEQDNTLSLGLSREDNATTETWGCHFPLGPWDGNTTDEVSVGMFEYEPDTTTNLTSWSLIKKFEVFSMVDDKKIIKYHGRVYYDNEGKNVTKIFFTSPDNHLGSTQTVRSMRNPASIEITARSSYAANEPSPYILSLGEGYSRETVAPGEEFWHSFSIKNSSAQGVGPVKEVRFTGNSFVREMEVPGRGYTEAVYHEFEVISASTDPSQPDYSEFGGAVYIAKDQESSIDSRSTELSLLQVEFRGATKSLEELKTESGALADFEPEDIKAWKEKWKAWREKWQKLTQEEKTRNEGWSDAFKIEDSDFPFPENEREKWYARIQVTGDLSSNGYVLLALYKKDDDPNDSDLEKYFCSVPLERRAEGFPHSNTLMAGGRWFEVEAKPNADNSGKKEVRPQYLKANGLKLQYITPGELIPELSATPTLQEEPKPDASPQPKPEPTPPPASAKPAPNPESQKPPPV